MFIIDKKKIKVIEKNNEREDKSSFARSNAIFKDYKELDIYLKTEFIPNHVLLRQREDYTGKKEDFLLIELHHIMALKLSEAEIQYVINYLDKKGIYICDINDTVDYDVEKFDYVTIYKNSKLSLPISSAEILQKIKLYKETKDKRLQNEKGIYICDINDTVDYDVEKFDYVTIYKNSKLSLPISSAEILQKIKLYKETKDKRLQNEIIKESMVLVPDIARRYSKNTHIDQQELESYGYEGLVKALEKFNINRGNHFFNYAITYIRGYILTGIRKILLCSKDSWYYDYINAKRIIEKERGVTLEESPELIEDVIELLIETGKTKNNKENRDYFKRKIISMLMGNASLDDDELVEEMINNGQLVDPTDCETQAENSEFLLALDEVLMSLTYRERDVLKLKYGLNGASPMSRPEIAKRFQVTPERIRQIEQQALIKLKSEPRRKYLQDLVD